MRSQNDIEVGVVKGAVAMFDDYDVPITRRDAAVEFGAPRAVLANGRERVAPTLPPGGLLQPHIGKIPIVIGRIGAADKYDKNAGAAGVVDQLVQSPHHLRNVLTRPFRRVRRSLRLRRNHFERR